MLGPQKGAQSEPVARIRADNPSPLTLDGTNSYVVGSQGCFVVDPGPALDAHLDALVAEVRRRGGATHVALTHDHADHSEGVAPLVERLGGDVPVVTIASDRDGLPFGVVETPGHARDHVCFTWEGHGFTGDAVLGAGSVFVQEDMGGYLRGLQRLRDQGLHTLHPGHGPRIDDPAAKIDQYVAHRGERERKLVAALERGLRATDDLLDAAWAEVPAELRPAAAVTLGAHLDKLRAEGRYS